MKGSRWEEGRILDTPTNSTKALYDGINDRLPANGVKGIYLPEIVNEAIFQKVIANDEKRNGLNTAVIDSLRMTILNCHPNRH